MPRSRFSTYDVAPATDSEENSSEEGFLSNESSKTVTLGQTCATRGIFGTLLLFAGAKARAMDAR